MRKLSETELFSVHLSQSEQSTIKNIIETKLNQNVGIIAPEHIEPELAQLKIKAKKYPGLLSDAISHFEVNGRIRLFNLGSTSSGRSPVPPFIPFIAGAARNKQLEGNPSSRGTSPAIFVNMYRIGKWAADESNYSGVSASTDLFATLETGVIAYKMLAESKSEKVFSNNAVVENLTNIYTSLFAYAITKTVNTFGSDFNTDAARYLISKFFLRYVLKRPDSDTVNEIAHNTVKFRTSMKGLETFEENYPMDYSSLSKFLEAFGLAFFNNSIDIGKFTINWLSIYGEGLLFAIEYAPFLLHFLFSTYHGANLGGSTKLYNKLDQLQKDGLIKLYNSVISELR
jgi:hypothetical protein